MSNMLRTGVAWLQQMRSQNMSDSGVYARGAFSIPALLATPGKTEFEIDNGESVRIESNLVDWIVTASDLVLNNAVTVPKRGDTFTTGGKTYEVMQPDGLSQPYRLDPTGQQLRIHTKRVG